jgi:hypothetical protein
MVVGSSRRVDDRAGVTSPDTVWVGRFEARSVMGVVECQKSSGSKPFRGDCPVGGWRNPERRRWAASPIGPTLPSPPPTAPTTGSWAEPGRSADHPGRVDTS